MSTANTSKRSRQRNTQNSLSSVYSPGWTDSVTQNQELESDDNDVEMDSSSSTEPTKRIRPPNTRYSPDTRRPQKFNNILSVDTSFRNTDLNADGSGPSSSSAPHSNPPPDSEKRESRRREEYARRRSVNQQEEAKKRQVQSAPRPRKKRSPSPQTSQDEHTCDSDEGHEYDHLPIVRDDPSYKITPEHKKLFKEIRKRVDDRLRLNGQIVDVNRSGRPDSGALPRSIHFGTWIMKTWYDSPFPAEYVHSECLLICEFCLFYARSDPVMQNHAKKCRVRAPPGVEIYRKDNISVFEVDGKIERGYCQNVCLISRLFLESKTVFYDTEPFFFYVVTENDQFGCHFAGYFSKEKYEPDRNNLSCIMTLPCHQEKGYGRFLIDVSYALSRREKWFGGPEQPLSDLGKIAYGSYWRGAIIKFLKEAYHEIEFGDGVSIMCISEATGINPHEVTEFLDAMKWITVEKTDGVHITDIEFNVDWAEVDKFLHKQANSTRATFDESCLYWTPRKITPMMDGFQDTSRPAEQEENIRRLSTPKTPATEPKSTPSTSLSKPVGSVKKELRSRGTQRATASRNLNAEWTKKVTLPEWADTRDASEDDEEKKDKRKRRKSRCGDSTIDSEKPREDTPEDEGSSKHLGRRSRGNKITEDAPESRVSEQSKTGKSTGGRYRNRKGGKEMYEDSNAPSASESSDDDDDDTPFGSTGHKGRKGKKGNQRKKSISRSGPGKQFPSTSEAKSANECDSDDSDDDDDRKKPGTSRVRITEEKSDTERIKESEGERMDQGEAVDMPSQEDEMKSDDEPELQMEHLNEEVDDMAGYTIHTPESYHSASASPAPQMISEEPIQQLQPQGFEQHHFEENDTAPPLLVSEVANHSANHSMERREELDTVPPLAQNAPIIDGYSTGDDDDAPPRLSPQFGKNEDHEEDHEKDKSTTEIMVQHNGSNGMQQHQEQQQHAQQYQMSAGPSTSMHMTPMMSTPQHVYSQPNSHQQATPGSGGIPSCGGPPQVYNHSTPEQQQQFMSPQMGVPNSVSSVHSVHNNNSMEMVGGPASLQHTPQQQPPPYDMGHPMGQIPQDNGVMTNGNATIEQQNQMIMQVHGFGSPPTQNNVPMPAQLPPQPPQVAPMAPTAAPTNGRRRSAGENGAGRKQRQNQQRNGAAAVPPVMVPMHGMYPMQVPFPYPHPAYGSWNPQMWDNIYPQNYYYPAAQNPQWQQLWQQQQLQQQHAQQQNPHGQNGQMPVVDGAQFPPGAHPWYQQYR